MTVCSITLSKVKVTNPWKSEIRPFSKAIFSAMYNGGWHKALQKAMSCLGTDLSLCENFFSSSSCMMMHEQCGDVFVVSLSDPWRCDGTPLSVECECDFRGRWYECLSVILGDVDTSVWCDFRGRWYECLSVILGDVDTSVWCVILGDVDTSVWVWF